MNQQTDNRFKARLQAGEKLIGLWLTLADPYCAEICAGAGFDWLLIDGEHAPNDLRSVLAQLQAISPYGVEPVVRPVVGETARIKQLLDIGVRSLLIPMVETAAQAAEMVRAVRYPPLGVRGVGSPIARVSRWGRVPDYMRDADESICLLLQVESAEALKNLDEILEVPGIDGIFIGAVDLSASLGHMGDTSHPVVVAAIADALTRIHAKGIPTGTLTGGIEPARKFIAAGSQFVAVGVDSNVLARGTEALARAFKPNDVPGVPAGGVY